MRDSLEQHQLVTENVPALIVHVGADHYIRYANRVATEWYAQPSADAARTRKIDDFIDPSRRGEWRLKVEAALAGRTIRGEEKALFPDGCERWCDTIRVPDCGQDGTVRGYFVLSVDITERKRIEDQLRQAQKIEAIGQLAGGIAHDSNNMLAATLGNLDLLLDALPPAEVAPRSLAERAIEAAERVADLNRRLLAFARKQTLRPQIDRRQSAGQRDGDDPAADARRNHRDRSRAGPDAVARPDRSDAIAERAAQPRPQRAGRHGGQRTPDDQNRECRARPATR